MAVESGVIFYFYNVPVNIMQNTPFKNITWFESDDHFLRPCQGKLAGGIQFHGCSGMTSLQTL